ncbi:MAG: tilS [Phycisphaerales bacterium]|nr:tilS [Phycisphaerales bacterium]
MGEMPANPSARYRTARAALFRKVVAEHGLAGVILAHHADDQAETILHRLLRASGPMGLAGMEPRTDLGGLIVLRPLLGMPRVMVRGYLNEIAQDWREDASNAGDKYLRNRLRRLLAEEPDLTARVLKLGDACRNLRDWARSAAPQLPASFPTSSLAALPPTLATETARRWLIARGVPPAEITPHVTDRLIQMCADAASPARAHFPGRLLVGRRRGVIAALPVS